MFFIDGLNERGLTDGINTETLKLYQKTSTYKYWDMYKPTSLIFLKSLPFTQLVEKLKKKSRTGSKNLDSIECPKNSITAPLNAKIICLPYTEVAKSLENFMKIRKSICKEFHINCHTMLQPIATVHGNYFTKYEEAPAAETSMWKDTKKKYETKIIKHNLLKKIPGIIDISSSLDNEKAISYVDRSHYSPKANKAIANYIFTKIKSEIYE